MSHDAEAHFNTHIVQNPYPGRGVVLGQASDGGFLLIYWIMGRSENSRNRRFVVDGHQLRTEAVDPSLVADPSLIIYEAMLELPKVQLVSNGDQTRTIHSYIERGQRFEDALLTREREPDAPNFTPRISGMLDFRTPDDQGLPACWLAILKAGRCDTAQTDRSFHRLTMPPPGLGYGITTYMGDGNPLPSFTGEPLLLPCEGNSEAVLNRYFDGLNADNRISVAVKRLDSSGATEALLVRNRFGD